ncbi:MAG: methionine--tRNA ligase subunit beta, partial [Acidobacteriaceae bacterium]
PKLGFETSISMYQPQLDSWNFSRALEALWSSIALLDAEITGLAPWKIAAEDTDSSRLRLAGLLYEWAEAIRIITALVYPVLPDAATKVWAQLGLGDIKKADLKNIAWGGLKPGTKLGELGPVFPRAEKDAVQKMKEIEEKNAGSNAPGAAAEQKVVKKDKSAEAEAAAEHQAVSPAPAKQGEARHEAGGRATPAAPAVPETGKMVNPQLEPRAASPGSGDKITIDDFAKVELRVAQIKVAERVPKADKLLRLEVDLGYEQRQILAGIAEAYAPESLVGRKIVIVANLAPRKLRGLESNGMLLAASLEGGKPVLASFLEDVEIGARLK